MLFHVRMTVRLPHDMPTQTAEEIKRREREMALRLQAEGSWRHLWRIAGQYANISIFDLPDAQALHDLLSALPLFPYMQIEVQPLCQHPSALEAAAPSAEG